MRHASRRQTRDADTFEAAPRGVKGSETSALQAATDLLRGPPIGNLSVNGSAEVTRDPNDVNFRSDTDPLEPEHPAARAQLEANAGLEEARLAQLSPEDRARYEAVKARCLEVNDPLAALALQKLLLEGKLPGATDLRTEGTTLQHLAALADERTPLAEGLDRDQLVTDLVQELATPSSINQGPYPSCAPTALAVQLAMENPAEYARIAAGLASPSGEVVLAGDGTLRREPDTEILPDSRSMVQRLMGPAMMEMASVIDYDERTRVDDGTTAAELDVLYDQLTGREMSYRDLGTDEQRVAAMQTIDAELAQGQTVPVGIEWAGGFHKVLVTGIEIIDGVDYVTYTNPQGTEERMRRDEFVRRLSTINWDPA